MIELAMSVRYSAGRVSPLRSSMQFSKCENDVAMLRGLSAELDCIVVVSELECSSVKRLRVLLGFALVVAWFADSGVGEEVDAFAGAGATLYPLLRPLKANLGTAAGLSAETSSFDSLSKICDR